MQTTLIEAFHRNLFKNKEKNSNTNENISWITGAVNSTRKRGGMTSLPMGFIF